VKCITTQHEELFVKKVKTVVLMMSLSMVMTANLALAHEEEQHEKKVRGTLFQFIALGLGSFAAHRVSTAMELDTTTTAVLQLTNALGQGGMIFDKPELTDLGARAIVAAGAAAVASHPLIASNLQNVPFVGQHLKAAGSKGVALTTVAFYELMKQGYNKVVDHMPVSVQHAIRGE